MMGVRCTTAGALLLAVAAARGERLLTRAWADAAVAGALMFAIAYGALAWAEQRLASGVTALLVASVPFWLVLMEWAARGLRPTARTLGGLTLGLGGVALLVARGLGPLSLAPAAAVLGGEVAWAAGTVFAQPRLPKPLALNAGMPLTAGGLLLLAWSAVSREARHFDPRAVSAASALALAYLIVFGSIVAFSAYAWLLRGVPAARVSTHAYVNPLVALALGAVVAGEPVTATIAIAGGVIAVGVTLVLAEETRKPAPVWRPLREMAQEPAAAWRR